MEDVKPVKPGDYHLEHEPVVRIGIVLAEDEKKMVPFQVPRAGYSLVADGDTIDVTPGNDFVVVAKKDQVEVNTANGTLLMGPFSKISLVPPSDENPQKAGDGTLVRGIVAGRGFHWQKEIEQTLSDTLEFQARDGALIMVNALPLETYLVGVITGEMSGECPIEFLKAQATAARSWLLGQKFSTHKDEPYFWCNDDCCQRYQGTGGWSDRARQAIDECRGMVLITENNLYCDARYSKSTGGISEDASEVWPKETIEGLLAKVDAPVGSEVERFFPVTDENVEEYLTGDWLKNTDAYASANVVPESTITKYLGRVDEAGEYFRWVVPVTQESLQESMRKRAGLTDLDKVVDLRTGRRGKSGRLSELFVDYTTSDGTKKTATIGPEYYIRAALSVKFLFSSALIIKAVYTEDGFLEKADLIGGGWGHGAGLCQIGGLGRAIKGQNYDEILLHYYSDVKLEKIYD